MQRMSVAPQATPMATRAGMLARLRGSSAQKQNAMMSGGTAAGMMIGHMNGTASGSASSSAAVIAASPDAGIRISATRAAAPGIAPFVQATIVRTASSTHKTMISAAP